MKRIIRYLNRRFKKSDEQKLILLADEIFAIMKRNDMIRKDGDSMLNQVQLNHWDGAWQHNKGVGRIDISYNTSKDELKGNSKLKSVKN